MASKSGTMDSWRNYFRTSSADIFNIIEHAIMIAASDCPQEFRVRRDRIAETLFSCKLARCVKCDSIELSVPSDLDDDGCKSGFDTDGCEFGSGISKESKVNSTRDDRVEMNVNQESNYSYGEAEALTAEIEEQSQIVGEVLRIKEILRDSDDESESVIFDSLRRLQLMALSVDTLKTTEIGKCVNVLRKHRSKQIRHLAGTLIDVWKDMVDEWVNSTSSLGGAEGTPESVKQSVVDDVEEEEEEEEEEGLPSPPLDEGAFFATQPATMELAGFFDGMDDDGNPRSSGDFIKNRGNVRKPSTKNQNIPKRKQQVPDESYISVEEKKGEILKEQEYAVKKQDAVVNLRKPSNSESGSERPTKVKVEQKVRNETKFQNKSDRSTIQKKPLAAQQDKLRNLDDAARLEVAKRKLHERYQEAKNAKRQRTIQVMELQDLPKQGLGHRNPHVKPGNHNRHWTNGRH